MQSVGIWMKAVAAIRWCDNMQTSHTRGGGRSAQNRSLPGNSWLSSASSSSLSIGGSRTDTGAPDLSIVSEGIR